MQAEAYSCSSRHFSIIGAGLAGALLAVLLAKRGIRVDVYERRQDPRQTGYSGGRSINLALAERGLDALRQAGADAAVLQQAVMMRGRMVHPLGGEPHLQRYGKDDSEVIWSINRGELNCVLLDAAEQAGARLHFNHRLHHVDFENKIFFTVADDASADAQNHAPVAHPFSSLIGADGAGSALRAAMATQIDLGARTEWLGHGYKELEIPPDENGDFRIEPNALHIWPRGGYMCIALPNDEKTFTVTLFLPTDGEPSFASISDGAQALAFFAREFGDALPLIPNLREDFDRNPVGSLATLYLQKWHVRGDAVLLGDAAHAMVPFHGQGMNCAFEDCLALARACEQYADCAQAFAAFEKERAPNAFAIQQMALENYIEMRDRVDDADYLLQRQLEQALAKRHPERFIPRYSMVSFTRIPYQQAFARGAIQRQLLVQATAGHQTLEDIDWDTLDAQILAQLSPITW